jgi:MoaA/NifB/PqqE/SkfB family radical SAM enzyme
MIEREETSILRGMGLEVIGRCNAVCEFCSVGLFNRKFRAGETEDTNLVHKNVFTGEVITRSDDKIKLELIDKIFEIHKPRSVIFTGLMEPFLAADRIWYVVDKLEATGDNYSVSTYTNGSVIKEEHMVRILENPHWRSLQMSFNAATEKTRQAVMGLPLARSEENLKLFLKLRTEMGREDDFDVGCVMMLLDTNRDEDQAFQAKWREIFKGYKNCHPPGTFFTTNWNGSAPSARWLRSWGSQYCAQWGCDSPTISVDGEIYLCCYSTKYSFGNIMDPDALYKWRNRKTIFGVGDTDPPPESLCGDCNGSCFGHTWA